MAGLPHSASEPALRRSLRGAQPTKQSIISPQVQTANKAAERLQRAISEKTFSFHTSSSANAKNLFPNIQNYQDLQIDATKSMSSIQLLLKQRDDIYSGNHKNKPSDLAWMDYRASTSWASNAKKGVASRVGKEHMNHTNRHTARKEIRAKLEKCRSDPKALSALRKSIAEESRRKKSQQQRELGNVIERNIEIIRCKTPGALIEQKKEKMSLAAEQYDMRREAALGRIQSRERAESVRAVESAIKLGLIEPGVLTQVWDSGWYQQFQMERSWFVITYLTLGTQKMIESIELRRKSSSYLRIARSLAIIMRRFRLMLIRVRLRHLVKCRRAFHIFVCRLKAKRLIKHRREAARLIAVNLSLHRFNNECIQRIRIFLRRIRLLQRILRNAMAKLQQQHQSTLKLWEHFDREKLGVSGDTGNEYFQYSTAYKEEQAHRLSVLKRYLREKKKKYIAQVKKWLELVDEASPVEHDKSKRPRFSLEDFNAADYQEMQRRVDELARAKIRAKTKMDLSKSVSRSSGVNVDAPISSRRKSVSISGREVKIFQSGLFSNLEVESHAFHDTGEAQGADSGECGEPVELEAAHSTLSGPVDLQ